MEGCVLHVSAVEGVEIRTDRAIPAALLVNELVTNSAKYAYPAGNCRVWITLSRAQEYGGDFRTGRRRRSSANV
jgi:two-component sensor histidine kinase